MKYPHYLIIYLNRFEDTFYGKVKLNTMIEINLELDLSSYYSPILREINNPESDDKMNKKTMKYDLIGIIHHNGNLN
jgi:ubiquitin C-terminal hydrolase